MFEKGLEPFDEARAVVRELIDEYRAAEKPEYVVRTPIARVQPAIQS